MKEMVIGMDLGGTNIKVSLFNRFPRGLCQVRIPTQAQGGPERVLDRMRQAVEQLCDQAGVALSQINCVGIGVPGLLDMEAGLSRFSPNFPGWKDVPVAARMQECLGIPVFIDNDVRVNLYGEWLYGAGQGVDDLVLLTLGTGLGAGVVTGGRVLYGATSSAGEIGHMNMFREGRPCRCGSSGCLGRYVSALGMLRTVREKLESGRSSLLLEWTNGDADSVTAKMVSEACDLGDAVACEALKETGELLGYGLLNVVNLYNPRLIVVGGGMAQAGERLLRWTREIVSRRALQISREACSIVVARLGDSAGMVGAAAYAAGRSGIADTL